MKKEIFDKGMIALARAYPERKFDCEVMWDFLGDLEDHQFLKGVAEVINSNKDLYPGSNIIAYIRQAAILKISEQGAGEAWGDVMKAIGSFGYYGTPKFDNPLTQKTVECLGWRSLCLSENISVERAHFLKIYESIKKRMETEQLRLPESRIQALLEKPKGEAK